MIAPWPSARPPGTPAPVRSRSPMASTAARASERAAPSAPGRDQPRRAPFGVRRQRPGPTLERIDDRVDLPARIAQPFLDPLVEPLLEGLFPVAQILLSRLQLRALSVSVSRSRATSRRS